MKFRIEVKNISKSYKIYEKNSDRLKEWIFSNKVLHRKKNIIQDISFNVAQGESVGIIGINGAGKSTLLKIIAGIVKPTEGLVTIHGSVSGLLELGMGFHPEFTGRQNLYLAGQLYGYTHSEITSLFQEIEDFAEIGDYIDQPIRTYSSGMQVRLAFSLATAKRPDILIIDEALSVGDVYFQHKSFDRIKKFREMGTTLLFVSHSKETILSICDRAILLDHSKMAIEGDPESVMDYYNAMLARHQKQKVSLNILDNGKTQTVSGTGEATVTEIKLLNARLEPSVLLEVGEKVSIVFEVLVKKEIPRLILGFSIKDKFGQVVYGTNTHLLRKAIEGLRADEKIQYSFDLNLNIGPGSYSIQTALVSTENHLENNYEWRDFAHLFTVVNRSKDHFAGNCWLDAKLTINYRA